MGIKCYKCGHNLDFTEGQDVGRSEECPKCHASLRVCKMCSFYDKNAYNECLEPMADRIVDKEKANFCDYFKIGNNKYTDSVKEDALKRANSLFKK